MKMRKSVFSALGLTFCAGMMVLMSSCKEKAQAPQQSIPELATIVISEETATLNTEFPATLHGKNDVEIRPQISGFLTSVNVQEGQKVNAGQVLFTIDQVSLKAAVESAEAAVAVAQANVNTATTQANNDKILLEKNIISASAAQTSQDALNAAKAQLNQARAAVVQARKNLSYSVVTAPQSGVVGTIEYKEGALVSPSTLLTILSNNGDMEAYFSMNEKSILDLTDNGKVSMKEAIASLPEVELQLANGEVYGRKGKIISISGVLDPATGSATVKALFPNPDGMLHSGNTGKVLIPNSMAGAIEVPQKAVFEIQDMKYCFVVGDNSKVHSTPITVSEQNNGQTYIVLNGLQPGDRVVTEGVGVSVKDGMEIKVKN